LMTLIICRLLKMFVHLNEDINSLLESKDAKSTMCLYLYSILLFNIPYNKMINTFLRGHGAHWNCSKNIVNLGYTSLYNITSATPHFTILPRLHLTLQYYLGYTSLYNIVSGLQYTWSPCKNCIIDKIIHW
jgi:hypothetical protein